MVCGDDETYLVDLSLLVGISELRVTHYEITEDANVVFHSKPRRDWARCSRCNTPSHAVHDSVNHTVRDAPVLGNRCYLAFPIRRFECEMCHRPFTERLGCINSVGPTVRMQNSRRTARYEEYVYQRCRESSIASVKRSEGLSYNVVKRIYYETIKGKLVSRRTERLRVLGIDEISQRKGHKDKLGVLYNIEAGHVWDVLPNRLKATVEQYLDDLPDRITRSIEAVTIDMWKPYQLAVQRKLPNATIVVDPFHVIQELNDCVTACRRELQRLATDKEKYKHLKGIRWVLVKNEEDLDEDGQARLAEVYQLWPELGRCHRLKEDFRAIYKSRTRTSAAKKLAKWEKKAKALDLKRMDKFLTTLDNWREWILNFFDERMSNGRAEGLNNKIKLIKRRGFGYRNHGHFRARILDECGPIE